MQWTKQQGEALAAIKKWLADPKAPQIFRLYGFAGTGKTTIAKELKAMVKGTVLYATYTGKAALVLRKKGCENARTIHRTIYKPAKDGDGRVVFTRDPDSELATAALLVLDESSMVGDRIADDLKKYKKRILVIADPAQLPPVRDAGTLTQGAPDYMLTDIRRQAADNPIIRMSMDIRAGKPLAVGKYGASVVKRGIDKYELNEAEQVIAGTNIMRRHYINEVRALRKFSGNWPMSGERVIGLRNNYVNGVLNGSIWSVHASDATKMRLWLEDDDATKVETVAWRECFVGKSMEDTPWYERKKLDEFDFSYVITCHKSQGSQWDDVLVIDESKSFRADADKWLYTAVTRAAERITVIVP